MKLRRTRITVGLAVLALVASVPLASTALAEPTVLASITEDPVAPGVRDDLTITVQPSEGTLESFTLTPPANWLLVSVEPSEEEGPSYAIDSETNTLVGTNLSATSEVPASVGFDVKTGCLQGDWEWTLDAQGSSGESAIEFGNSVDSDLSTEVSEDCTLAITNQPTDAEKNTLITGTAFNSSTNPVTVELMNTEETPQIVTHFPVGVTFDLAPGTGLVSSPGLLTAATKTTVNGVATFSGAAGTLEISAANVPLTSDYKLRPKTAGTYAGLTGNDSAAFDIWEDGCRGQGCNINLRNGNESYTANTNVGLGASVVPAGAPADEISCPTQRLIFGSSVFFHVTTNVAGTDTVFLETHILREDMKQAANNGQKLVGWCIGLKNPAPWVKNGASYAQQTRGGQVWYVAMAPKCPNKKNPADFAPCIVSQFGDNNGGSFIRGYVLGGDPPRRT